MIEVILVAPNVSEQFGGESIKALQIYEELALRSVEVHQITHERVRKEVARRLPEMRVSYVEEDLVQRLLYRSVVLRWFLDPYFSWRSAKIVSRLMQTNPGAIVHYTSPVSPIMPIFIAPGARVVIGPLNGNIRYPRAFRNREPLGYTVRRLLYPWGLLAHRLFFSGKRSADVILVAGGDRTIRALLGVGCRPERMRASLDSGIPNRLGDEPRIRHSGRNCRFVHNGRLVAHKGTDLIIKSLARTRLPIELDIIGRGPTEGRLESLTKALGLQKRVRFLGWLEDHSQLYPLLRSYRGFVLPSLAEANAIAIQEAMMLGLPVICLDWGGPSRLVTPECGILIPPLSESYVIEELANAMDRFADDAELSEQMSVAGRQRAMSEGFLWSEVIENLIDIYEEIAGSTTGNRRASDRRRGQASCGQYGAFGGDAGSDIGAGGRPGRSLSRPG